MAKTTHFTAPRRQQRRLNRLQRTFAGAAENGTQRPARRRYLAHGSAITQYMQLLHGACLKSIMTLGEVVATPIIPALPGTLAMTSQVCP
jgi:hypothetical protein